MRQTLLHLSGRATSVLLLALATLAPTIAWAQAAAPQPVLKRSPPVWIGYLLMAVLLGIVLAVSLVPSKRSHQD